MSTSSPTFSVRGIDVEVVYKDIKNLHIGVYPPHGKVRVAAPARLDQEQVCLAVIQRLPWIKRHRQQLQEAARQTPREMVTGESHYVWGKRLRLMVIEQPGPARVTADGERLRLLCPPGSSLEYRLVQLEDWRRAELRQRLQVLITKWEPVIGRQVPYWNIRKMKTRWGTCNTGNSRIWFNLDLAQRLHNDRFVALMDGFMSDWRQRRDELNRAPLGHEEWTC
jgi:predicted metal-dependent hydrolase